VGILVQKARGSKLLSHFVVDVLAEEPADRGEVVELAVHNRLARSGGPVLLDRLEVHQRDLGGGLLPDGEQPAVDKL
jgi:hypothetical protein